MPFFEILHVNILQIKFFTCFKSHFIYVAGHCFRRSSATIIAEEGGTDAQLMNHGNWKSTKMVQRYMANTKNNQLVIAKLLTGVQVMTDEKPVEKVIHM